VKAYDQIDREYWPAHVAAGEYFLTHDNAAEATKELKAAIQKRAKDESRTMNAELNVVLWRTFGPYRSSFGD